MGEDKEITSQQCTFGEGSADGVTGEILACGFNHAKVTINTEARYPMPTITINGIEYPLDKDVEADGIKITAGSDLSETRSHTLTTA